MQMKNSRIEPYGTQNQKPPQIYESWRFSSDNTIFYLYSSKHSPLSIMYYPSYIISSTGHQSQHPGRLPDYEPQKKPDPNYLELKMPGRTCRLPPVLTGLKDEIEASKYILELEAGWDGENGEAYSVTVWERAVTFLADLYVTVLHTFNIIPDYPRIYHGPDGSIDVLWETNRCKILANFPKDERLHIDYYGEYSNQNSFKGSFGLSDKPDSLIGNLIGLTHAENRRYT